MNIEDLKGRLTEKAANLRLSLAQQARQTEYEAQAMSELIADPNWEIWQRSIQAEKARHQAIFKGLGDNMLSGRNKITLEAFQQLKIELATHEAWIMALNFAVAVAKNVIEKGEQAAEEVKHAAGE